ncbi:interleukin-6 receptor subunit beta isoform 2-T2 [Pholidichthys leucotaenia]
MVFARMLQLLVSVWLLSGLPAGCDRLEKPENLSCIAVQEGTQIAERLKCSWEARGRHTTDVRPTYTLFVSYGEKIINTSVDTNSATVSFDTYPNFMSLDIWVEAHNNLGKVESEHLIKWAGEFVKPNPPSNVTAISEKNFTKALLIKWKHSLINLQIYLKYQIRFCQQRSNTWTDVPLADTSGNINSFRLQNLQPDTVYVTQVRCIEKGYWSDWSANSTEKTPEDRPTSKPDLWMTMAEVGTNERRIELICKDPVFSNGKIKSYRLLIKTQSYVRNETLEKETILGNGSSSQKAVTLLKTMPLHDQEQVEVHITAINSVGESPKALLVIPPRNKVFLPVKGLKAWSHDNKLMVKWDPPKRAPVSYVVQWHDGKMIDWQREGRNTTNTSIRGSLKPFVCYNILVNPIYKLEKIGQPAYVQAYLKEGEPLEGPTVKPTGDPGKHEADLVWEPIPLARRQGFITNYKIHYTSATKTYEPITVPANTTSYTLKNLSSNTQYDVWVEISTISGSKQGSKHSFTTLKYGPGEIEGIVVGVSLGFLFVVVMTMLVCFYKKDVIKEKCWPQIPNPGESTIGSWSPDYPLKTEMPKENCLSDISVLDVDMCDAKCVFEEDKASLPKKDKYLSEEHSSGIGGSSCMSSPRQSVSDSDEGGDMGDTTASTVQYSSVVASSGYKGQTPNSLPKQAIFSRSESTQPLLDSEENPDMSTHEGSRQSQRFLRQSHFAHSKGATVSDALNQEMEQQEFLEFAPLEEDNEQASSADGQSADWVPASSYMPQLGGYRPQ